MANRKMLLLTSILAAGTGTIFIIGPASSKGLFAKAHAGQSSLGGKECSVATLYGEYLYTGSAEANIKQRDDPTYPRVFAGLFSFDGAGNLSGFDTRSFGGDITRRQAFTGTYTLNSDCTGTIHYFSTIDTNWDLFVSTDGIEGNLIRYDPGIIATRSFKKQ